MTPAWPIVAMNAQGENVKSIQYFLDQRGQNLVVDGDFGPLTQAAVKAFQTSDHLTVDGIVGPQTWPALLVQTSQGSVGDGVKALQSQIASRGPSSYLVAVDGDFGPETLGVTEYFQTLLGLTADGIAGPITWSYLTNGYLLASSPGGAGQDVFQAWTQNNAQEAGKNATPATVAQLFAQAWSAQAGWTGPEGQGAAGTIYYTWQASNGKKLTIAVQDGAGGFFVADSAQFQ